ncbi:alpha/beta fold hydrolase [Pontibaca salina]|uniref:Alpha/beta hydrolase n=1 Tax=Pontibaca salina TaxID=2795731 RepID=A0A934HV80_9RHOB|nr:alpha/beta hydrolase [Pontibaca salina]MBI6630878.1 alpha/beta hydrolase [Pontibaca salina]
MLMFVESEAGRLECVASGSDSSGRTNVVLVHGIQGTAAIWAPIIPQLSDTRRILAPNLRGRAASFAPDVLEAYTMTAFASDLRAVIKQATGPIVLVGWSMGSLVALEYLKRYGAEGIIGLGLISGSSCLQVDGGKDAIWFHEETAEKLAEEAAGRVKRLQLTQAATDRAVAGSWLSARKADYRQELNSIKLPVLLIHGAEDPECPIEHAHSMANALPNARLEVWEDCGHLPMAHDPQRFASALEGFALSCETG